MNTEIRDHLTYIKSALDANGLLVDTGKSAPTFALYGARVYKTALQTITNITVTNLSFDAERFDSGFHDNATNNDRLTIPAGAGGYYLVGATIQWGPAAGGSERSVFLRHNGTTIFAQQRGDATSINLVVVGLYQFAAGDYVNCGVYHDAGANLDVLAAGNVSPEFWIHRLSST